MKNIHKTILFTSILCLIVIIVVIIVQLSAQGELVIKCSYLDPIAIDILAFLAALFLIIEGMYKIEKNAKEPLKRQITRAIRIAFGCSILTLHIIQFLYK